MKLNINALAQQHFKAMVTVSIPTEDIDKEGNTVYGKAKFIGKFRCLSVAEGREHLTELEALREAGNALAAVDLSAEQVARFFIGFEAAPSTELPFVDDDDNALQSTPENIALLLNSSYVRDAIQMTYTKARSEDVVGKNSKR
ncbi:hypothetical protein [Gilvimarinus agarilyticus]|uniref:hypothetical protein n=1 Tax=Gilvimarinus agarilyticus TaxID=679259 RepID=UPI0005A0F88C|nr:hypothetical protein [Gilvimarinus agarilyticus]